MTKRTYKIIVDGMVIIFKLSELLDNFKDRIDLQDTELHYTLEEELDTLLDMKKDEDVFFFEDRAKEIKCILKRTL